MTMTVSTHGSTDLMLTLESSARLEISLLASDNKGKREDKKSPWVHSTGWLPTGYAKDNGP
jgi:hypothetical protein